LAVDILQPADRITVPHSAGAKVKIDMGEVTRAKGEFGWLFLLLVFAGSWALWLPMAMPKGALNMGQLVAGACMPSILGIVLTMFGGRKRRRDFWDRAFNPTRISAPWYLAIFFGIPAVTALSFVVVKLAGATPPPLGNVVATFRNPVTLGTFILMMLVGGPLAEELGWRGYLLDRFQARWSALVSALLLWVIWGFWHLPLFFIKGTVQGAMGFPSWGFALWFAQVLPLTLIINAVYNSNRRSTFAAILIHFVVNFSWTLVQGMGQALPLSVELAKTAVLLMVALALVLWLEPATLAPRGRHSA
jgi:membrane protease YdiL (CAAX protease family)